MEKKKPEPKGKEKSKQKSKEGFAAMAALAHRPKGKKKG